MQRSKIIISMSRSCRFLGSTTSIYSRSSSRLNSVCYTRSCEKVKKLAAGLKKACIVLRTANHTSCKHVVNSVARDKYTTNN